ncbi:MAG TPA: ATP-binding cassette domain-containing protein [Bryobacteraceae bacterium]|nr:ATP-binding cassette domain-containing protein [Bryobacteraceae bacterium]
MSYSGRVGHHRIESAIQTIELTRRYDSLVAVNHLDFSAPAGSIFGLLGPNGAGKSTLVKMLTTLLPPSSGTALVSGFDVVRRPSDVRRNIGYVAQMISADGDLTGYENLLISAKLYGIRGKEREARIAGALDFMNLIEAAGKRVKQYSGGMIRRLEIAQSMLHRPAVLFLDEPTIGLDPVAKRSVWEHIRELRDQFGTTILMTTHDMEEADVLCDQVAIMYQGRIVSIGKPAELKANAGPEATLNDVFILSTGAAMLDGEVRGGSLRDVARTRRTARRME